MLRVCARHSGGTPVKVLLLARTSGSWWQTLAGLDPVLEEVLDGSPVTVLPALRACWQRVQAGAGSGSDTAERG